MMINVKKMLAVLIAGILLLSACGTVPLNPTTTEQTKPTEEDEKIPSYATRPEATMPDPATADMNINCQYLPEIIENPGNLPVLKWVCLTEYSSGGKYGRVWNESAAIELNQMLADRNMPFRVQFVLYTSDYAHANIEWFVRQEMQEAIAEADLLHGTVTAETAKDYFMPLTEYAKGNTTLSLKNAVPHEINWLKTTANGEIYGISQSLMYPENGGWVVDSSVISEYGLTEQDFQRNFWEMDDLLEKIYEKNGKKPFLYISPSSKMVSTDITTGIESRYPGAGSDTMGEYLTGIGSIFAMDCNQNNLTVVNMLDTDISRKIRDAIARYTAANYTVPDYRETLVYFFQAKGHKTYAYNDNYYIPIFTPTYNSGEYAKLLHCSGVSTTTKYKNEALSLLNLIAEDEEFRMHLMFGKEGRDYTFDEKGNYCITTQEDGSNYSLSFLSPWSKLSGMNGGSSLSPGTWGVTVQYEGMTALESYLEMWENVGEPYYTIRFDYSGLEKELDAVAKVCDLYFYRFADMTDEKYAEMIEKINAAGGTKIIAELQKQLDEWVKANPDKVAANRS